MSVNVAGPAGAITTAINGFNAGYHNDYQLVSGLATNYFAASAPSPGSVAPLAVALDAVLRNWGACRRSAPCVLPITQCSHTLLQPSLFRDLKQIRSNGLGSLSVNPAGARVTASGTVPTVLDAALTRVLDTVANGILCGNTNVTYPMKVALLLTGCMPAFDSQVRDGLANGGFVGMKATQLKMPNGVNEPVYKKITRLPYLLGDCWRRNPQIAHEVAASNHGWLQNHPGRVFDVLLFMQAAGPNLLSWNNARPGRWYDLP